MFATLVSYTIRAYTWHKYRVYVDVQALQVSLLAGRVFIKGFRYHGHNETILIQDGYITWRYWLRRVRPVQCSQSCLPPRCVPEGGNTGVEDAEAVNNKSLQNLPCRIAVKARGLQWFIYNRSPAYDAILKSMNDEEVFDDAFSEAMPTERKLASQNSGIKKSQEFDERSYGIDKKLADPFVKDTDKGESNSILTTHSSRSSRWQENEKTPELPRMLRLFPIRLDCNQGAVVMGNQNTRSILTAKFDSATGHLDARDSRPVDKYKQLIEFEFIHPVVQFKANEDFKEDQISEGARHKSEDACSAASVIPYGRRIVFWLRERTLRLWGSFRVRFPHLGGSANSLAQDHTRLTNRHRHAAKDTTIPGQGRWLGLTRYLDDDDELVEQERWKAIDYGQFPTIVDSPKIAMSFYWDVPGLVPISRITSYRPSERAVDDINVEQPPDWGVDLRVFGGKISYGPWADRQRADLQSFFFPSLHKDAIPAKRLKPGNSRVSTVFKLLVEIEEQTTLGIPTREESKDWKWKGRQSIRTGLESNQTGKKGHKIKKEGKDEPTVDIRSSGWLDIKLFPNSTISFTMDLVANRNGFGSRVDLDLKGTEISTSVNHGLLWRSKSHKISCDLSYPLKWNALHPWRIDIEGDAPDLFILRDHIFLLTDLVGDWASGPPADFHTFVPYKYILSLRFNDFKIYINTNDSNIINNPSDVDDNTFLVLWGKGLGANIEIPLSSFRPARNRVTFDANAHDGGMKLYTPAWSTYHTFLKKPDVALMNTLQLNGTYDYCNATSPGLTDIVVLDILGSDLNLHLYGFLVRYLIKIKDNYFGEDYHFRTVEEYQEQMSRKSKSDGRVVTVDQHARLSNDLDVILGLAIENLCILLPCNIYSGNESISMDLSSIGLDLRFTNYYMDLTVDFSPLAISHTSHGNRPELTAKSDQNTQVFIDGLQIFGHRLFGLPPLEPTYVCNWDFNIGSISGECCLDFLSSLLMSLKSFGFAFEDAENASSFPDLQVLHDTTFLRLHLQSVNVWLRLEQTAFLLSLTGAQIRFNDLAGQLFSEHLHFSVPNLTIAIVDAGVTPLDPSSLNVSAVTAAYFETRINVTMVKRGLRFDEDRQSQQSHIRQEDSRTGRTPWLIQDSQPFIPRTKINPPAMPFPSMPEPVSGVPESLVDLSTTSSKSFISVASKGKMPHKGSFLAKASSRQGKVERKYSGKGSMYQSQTVSTDQCQSWASIEGSPEILRRRSHHSKPCINSTWQSSSASNSGVHSPRTNIARPDLSFSSPYKKPYFPLSGTKLDLGAVPMLPSEPSNHLRKIETTVLENDRLENSDLETEQTRFMVHLGPGLRAFCTPVALLRINDLLERMQYNDPVTLLDILQIDAMAEVLKSIEKHEGHRRIVEMRFIIPHMVVRLNSDPAHGRPMMPLQHQYQLSLENLLAVVRSSDNTTNDENKTASNQLSADLDLNQLSLSAREFQERSEERAVIQFSIHDTVAGMITGSKSAFEVKFGDIGVIFKSREATFLASLLHRTFSLSHDIGHAFETRKDEQTPNLQLLLLFLTTNGDDIPDPPFLTKASYVLRSVTSHPRTVDSWKMMSRLRYVHMLLPDPLQHEMIAQSMQKEHVCPEDAANRVIASFEHWRAWDMAHVRKSHLIQRVYAPVLNPLHEELDRSVPLEATIKAGEIRLLIEPGPNQSELALESLVAGVAMNQAWLVNTRHTGEPSDHKGSIVQLQCGKTGLDVSWDLIQYFEEILALSEAPQSKIVVEQETSKTANASAGVPRLHMIVSSEINVFSLKSINLDFSSTCQGFKSSILLDPELQSPDPWVNALFAVDTITSKLQSYSRLLIYSKLYKPNISASTSRHRANYEPNMLWSIAGSCDDVLFETLEDPLSFLEITAIILKDEVAYISALTYRLKSTSKPGDQSSQEKSEDILRANVSLYLRSYVVRFAVLPSLIYSISGKAAQTSIEAGGRRKSEILLNFDLKEHSHILTVQNRDYHDDIAILRVPPINSYMVINLGPQQKSLVLQLMIEQILLDASTVHASLATLTRPEIANLSKEIKQELAHVQTVWKQEFGSTESASPLSAASQEPLLYSVHASLAGLVIRTDASKSAFIARPARLQLHSGRILLNATNRDSVHGQALRFPELNVKLKELQAELSKISGQELLSCGNVRLAVFLEMTSKVNDEDELVRAYIVRVRSPIVNLYAETASMLIDILGHLQDTLKKIDFSEEVKSLRRLTRARLRSESRASKSVSVGDEVHKDSVSPVLFSAMYSLEVTNICVCWKIAAYLPMSPDREAEDLILTITRIDLGTKRKNAARLSIENFQLEMAPSSKATNGRSLNSALLPEVVFNVAYLSTANDRRLAFQAAGKSLDIRLTSQFILPASDLRRSFAVAMEDVRKSTASWNAAGKKDGGHGKRLLGEKRLGSLLVDADFAGAVVYIQGRSVSDPSSLALSVLHGKRSPQHGRYGQFTHDNASSSTTLRAPGIALKVEYKDSGNEEPSLNAEVKVDASSNELFPAIVPLIMELSSSVKEIVGEADTTGQPTEQKVMSPKFLDEERSRPADPSVIFKSCKLNLGLRVCKQVFTLSCQPIARVSATAQFESIFITVNAVQTPKKEQFFTLSATFNHPKVTVQHIYSQKSTGSFDVDSIVLSLMNSKHVSTVNGLSAILKISPMKVEINAKQLHDFLLFREIWMPPDLRNPAPVPEPTPSSEPQAFIVQHYQQVAAAGVLPWNAAVSIEKLDVQLDLGQSLGKSAFIISNFWVSSKKSSDLEQNLCLGFEKVGVDCTGRMSGYIELQNFRVRTSIHWTAMEQTRSQAPLIQASLGFDHLRLKAAFDFQVFLIAEISTIEFLMYNIRHKKQARGDRLVGVVDGEKVQVFCTTTSASQGLALYQAIERLIQDKRVAYEASIRDIEKFLRRRSSIAPSVIRAVSRKLVNDGEKPVKAPLQLQTNVVVTLKAVNVGVFPSTFSDNQVFKLEVLNASAQFAVFFENGKIHSTLGMTLGELRVALSIVTRVNIAKTLGEVSVEEVLSDATGSRGGTILKVPKLVASMQTWQTPDSNQIDYTFSSSFQGKVDVGWNYSRISFLRDMWASHTQALAQRLGKPLPPSALQITGGLSPSDKGKDGEQGKSSEGGQEKITAVVNVPQSKYQYIALQPPIIETPQLRDMGEATPPLEWIGLHRERLPNLTHQIVIVSLLEVAKEVEDAYGRILGSS